MAPDLHIHIVALSKVFDVRVRLPAEALNATPGLRVAYSQTFAALPNMPATAPKILIVQRPWVEDPQAWCKSVARFIKKGWILVVEFDDHPALINELGGMTPSEQDWARFRWCHAVQTSTERLRQAFLPHNPHVKVFRNAIFDLPRFPQRVGALRVIHGAVGRGAYAVELAASLGGAIRDFPQAEFIVIADRAVFDALPTSRKTYYPYMAYERYLKLMRSCAVSLAPLEGLPFQDCKSDAKFLDAARGGVLTIASPIVYGETIVDGVNGRIARTLADWGNHLSATLADPAGRTAMARRAWEYVRDERMFTYQIAERRAWYTELWERRHELTRELVDRVPAILREFQPNSATVSSPAPSP